MPIFSLPSNYGIGTLGKEAYKFVDFLVEAKQTYWQVLPLGPTSYGDSPYQSFSTYAGNPYFVDLDILCDDGLLDSNDLKKIKVENSDYIDYGWLFDTRFQILFKAYLKGIVRDRKDGLNIYYSLAMPCIKSFITCIDALNKQLTHN